MNSKCKLITVLLLLFSLPKVNAAENILLYKGTFNRTIKVEELINFKQTKTPNNKLKNLMYITNIDEKELLKALSYEIDIPLTISSKLMNSKIGEVFLGRISKIIHPNKVLNKNIGIKAIRSAIILSSFNNNEKINIIDFSKAYPNKNIALNLNALNQALKKAETLNELIEFYSNSPFQKLKDGSSSI